MSRSHLLLILAVILSLISVPSSFAITIDFRVRSGNTGWEAAIFDVTASNTGGAQFDFYDSKAWPDQTKFYYTISWNASTGTAVFDARTDSSPLFSLSRTFSSLIGLGPNSVTLVGKDSDPGNLTMEVLGGPSFSTTGSPGWLTEQIIPVSDPMNLSLSGTFVFTEDIFGATGAENLKGQIEMRDFSAPVPEPSTMLLLGSGLLGLLRFRKKLRK
jgi:hypothetical protein